MRVLVCIQEGLQGEALLRSYVRRFYKEGDEVIVLHIARKIKLPTFAHGGGIGYVNLKAEVMMKDWWQKMEILRKNSENICTELGVRHRVFIRETDNRIGEAIVQSAAKFDVDMIVVGSKALGLIAKLFLGDVDDYIKSHSSIPTLLCPKTFA